MIQAEIDGREVTGREDLHRRLAEQLALPEWYGKNLDALYDCLTEPGEKITLTLRGREALEERLGGYARTFQRVLEEASRTGDRITLTEENEADGKQRESELKANPKQEKE